MCDCDAIKRMDDELDRIRWYVSQLGGVMGGIEPKLIAQALKTGDAAPSDLGMSEVS